jgi:hypothetical protein
MFSLPSPFERFISFLLREKINFKTYTAHSNSEEGMNNFKGGKIMAAGG